MNAINKKVDTITSTEKGRLVMSTPKLIAGLLSILGISLLFSTAAQAATYYVRPDGGNATQCNGLADAPYPGSGTNLSCAFNHPNWALSPVGSNPSKMVGGDTLIIDGTGKAQYMMGFKSPNSGDTSQCGMYWPWGCFLRPVPSGPDPAHPTRILGKGYDTGCAAPPQLWGTERVAKILNLNGSSNVEVQCLEVTDHSDCQEFGPNSCNRDTAPFGQWAHSGLEASDSSNVLIKNVNIHGMSHTGIKAGRLTDWTIEDSKITANSFVGWDGDLGAGMSSNSGTMTFTRTSITYSGCGETYPGLAPYNCYSQDQGGYGDGVGTQTTKGNWVFNNVDISHNVQDGLDLLYHDGMSGTITINRSRFEGNAGNQVKTTGPTVITNSALIGNCAYFANNPIDWQSSGFNSCRAGGNPLHMVLENGAKGVVYNSTLTSNGTVIVVSKGSTCNGTEKIISRNNIYLGSTSYFTPSEKSTLYYPAGATGNSDGSCGKMPFDDDYSVIYNTKYLSTDCSGKAHSKCVDPKLVEPIVSFYTGAKYNVALQSSSPAVDSGLVISGLSSLDYSGLDRGASWDIGANELNGLTPTSSTVTTNTVPEVTSLTSTTSTSTGSTSTTTAPTTTTSSTTTTTSTPTTTTTTLTKWFFTVPKTTTTSTTTTQSTGTASTSTASTSTTTTTAPTVPTSTTSTTTTPTTSSTTTTTPASTTTDTTTTVVTVPTSTTSTSVPVTTTPASTTTETTTVVSTPTSATSTTTTAPTTTTTTTTAPTTTSSTTSSTTTSTSTSTTSTTTPIASTTLKRTWYFVKR